MRTRVSALTIVLSATLLLAGCASGNNGNPDGPGGGGPGGHSFTGRLVN